MDRQRHSDYYEGILQLRNPSKGILKFMGKVAESGTPIFSQVKKVPNGYDFYFVSQKFLQSFGKKLQGMFGGEMKVSAKIHTRDRVSSKELYRVNVLLRFPFFEIGDIIEIKGALYKVTAIGKKVTARNLDTGKSLAFRYRDLPR